SAFPTRFAAAWAAWRRCGGRPSDPRRQRARDVAAVAASPDRGQVLASRRRLVSNHQSKLATRATSVAAPQPVAVPTPRALLRRPGVVRERRSSADALDVYYSLDLDQLRFALERSVQAPIRVCGWLSNKSSPVTPILCTALAAGSCSQ